MTADSEIVKIVLTRSSFEWLKDVLDEHGYKLYKLRIHEITPEGVTEHDEVPTYLMGIKP